jgi:hypothetical protein
LFSIDKRERLARQATRLPTLQKRVAAFFEFVVQNAGTRAKIPASAAWPIGL